MEKNSRKRLPAYFVRILCPSVVILLSTAILALGQQRPRASTPDQTQNSKPTPNGIAVNGLRNESLFKNFYLGDFVEIPFNREDTVFADFYSIYLDEYSDQCFKHLPDDKVPITQQKCTEMTVTRNGLGIETSRYCSDYITVETGRYADPAMYAVKTELLAIQAGDVVRNSFRILASRTRNSDLMNMTANLIALKADLQTFLKINRCDSPGLKQFQENLRLFALNKQPLRSEGSPPSRPAVAISDQNFTRLVDDLITVQSRSWALNRYIPGSVSQVRIEAQDDQGRPVRIRAGYRFDGFTNSSRGSATITFEGGAPQCIYYFDNPGACRSPDRKIVAAYLKGEYQYTDAERKAVDAQPESEPNTTAPRRRRGAPAPNRPEDNE